MKFNSLTHLQARSAPEGKYCDGQSLWLWKSSKRRGRWVLRIVVQGKRREMGLGSYPDVSIGEARERAASARRLLRDGVDPIEARKEKMTPSERLSVKEAIEICFEARRAELKDDGKAGRWMSALENHIIPKFGQIPVETVDQHVLKNALEPIWHSKANTAKKALNRMNLVLRHSAAMGFNVDLQATMKARALLGKQRHSVTHIPALPYVEAPHFYRFLCSTNTQGALALRFLMLTCTRSAEVRLATHDEVESDVWKIPAARTKAGRLHRVPLSAEAINVLSEARNRRPGRYFFTSLRGGALSDATLSKFMKDNGYAARPHGMRSTFRVWAEEQSNSDWETKEMSLGHAVGGSVERAYQRSDLIDKRRALLGLWSEFLVSLTR